MPPPKRHSLRNFILLILLILAVTAAALQSLRRAFQRITSDFFFPYLTSVNKAETALSNKSLLLENRMSLVSTIEKLQKENEILSSEISYKKKLEKENNRLRKLLQLKKRTSYKSIYAQIILRDPAFWDERFIIDKGSEAGIEKGSVVLASTRARSRNHLIAVIGRVRDVSKHTSTVTTIISKELRMSVKLPRSGATGILRGGSRTSSGLCSELNYLPRDLKYFTGQAVFTSGLSRFTPSSLFIGRLAGKENAEPYIEKEGNLYVRAQLIPAVDFDNLNFVLVMVKDKDK